MRGKDARTDARTDPLRAATSLIPLLRAAGPAGVADLWHADDLAHTAATAECTASGFASLDAQLPGGGWPQGQLIELLHDDPGIGELSLLAPALAAQAQAGRACVWVLPSERGPGADGLHHQALPYPPALIEAGMDPSGSIFVRPAAAREAWWAIEQSLRAAHLGALVGWLPTFSAGPDFRALRRLHLLAQRHRALLFVMRPSRCADTASPAVLRLRLACDGDHLTVTLLKRRGRPLIEPVVLQVQPARWNRGTTAARAAGPLQPARAVPLHAAPEGPLRTIMAWAQGAERRRPDPAAVLAAASIGPDLAGGWLACGR
jgi:protein ImuA